MKNTNNKTKTKNPIKRMIEASRLKKAERELLRMDDHMLADIGVSRGDVHGKIWGEF